jgi:hypothetical protein
VQPYPPCAGRLEQAAAWAAGWGPAGSEAQAVTRAADGAGSDASSRRRRTRSSRSGRPRRCCGHGWWRPSGRLWPGNCWAPRYCSSLCAGWCGVWRSGRGAWAGAVHPLRSPARPQPPAQVRQVGRWAQGLAGPKA